MNFQKVCICDKIFLTTALLVKAGESCVMDLRYLSQRKNAKYFYHSELQRFWRIGKIAKMQLHKLFLYCSECTLVVFHYVFIEYYKFCQEIFGLGKMRNQTNIDSLDFNRILD